MKPLSKNKRKKVITKTRKHMKRKIAKKVNYRDLREAENQLENLPNYEVQSEL